MSLTSQKMDISDPEVVKAFSEKVGDMLHLNHLYVLTVADMNATGLEMLGEVHAEFGGRHEVGPMNISEVFATLDAEGLFVERWEDEFQVLFRISFIG